MYQSSHPCKVYDSMFFSIFPDLYNHHQSRGKERNGKKKRLAHILWCVLAVFVAVSRCFPR